MEKSNLSKFNKKMDNWELIEKRKENDNLTEIQYILIYKNIKIETFNNIYANLEIRIFEHSGFQIENKEKSVTINW